MARASIWRMRSRVRLKCSPTSSRVRGSPRSSPNRSLRISRLAVVEGSQEAVDLLGQQRRGGHLEGRLGRTVLDDVAQLGVAVLAQGLGQRQRLGREAQRLGDLVLGHLHLGRELGQRGRTPELQLQAGPGLLQARQGVAGVHRQADGAAGVGDAAGDGLTDPPRGVGRELEALAPVELLDGVHQAEVALLDEVEQRQARGLVLLGDRHHQPEVGLDEGALGVLALPGDAPKLALLGRGELLAPGPQLLLSAPRRPRWPSPAGPRHPWSTRDTDRCPSGKDERGLPRRARRAPWPKRGSSVRPSSWPGGATRLDGWGRLLR